MCQMLIIYDHCDSFRKRKHHKVINSLTSSSRYFGVDIGAIQEYAKEFDDIEHLRAEIRLVMRKIVGVFFLLLFVYIEYVPDMEV